MSQASVEAGTHGVEAFDFVVIGSGPGGQKAAICAAKAGRRVALVEKSRKLGGECVHFGTIPSKTLRAQALQAAQLRRAAARLKVAPRADLELQVLREGLHERIDRYADTVVAQLERNGVECLHGRASFQSAHEIEVRHPDGSRRRLRAEHIVIAAGSRPRHPEGIPVDHEHVLDADSIVSLAYLPRTLAVLGAGVIACEYASVYAALGVEVHVVDRGERPLAFLDAELSEAFRSALVAAGARYEPGRRIASLGFDGVSQVALAFEDGERLETEKVFVALGRSGCLEELALERAGLEVGPRGNLAVDEHGRTARPHVYAVGDCAGPPALATAAMEQGRRAACHALGLDAQRLGGLLPTGIYTIPEIGSVGVSEAAAGESHGGAAVGRARFEEVARGQISELGGGWLKLVADPEGERLLGAHAIGEGAAELVHIGQMAIFAGARIDDLIDNVFNFPTLAEAYRIAALDLRNRLSEKASRD